MIRRPLIALALAYACRASAQGDDATLRQEVEELKARVSVIEKRLGEPPAAAAATQRRTASAEPLADLVGWRRIQPGMTRAQIESLLGEPQRAFQLDGSLVWYYRYRPDSAGSVFFDSAGRVSSFQRP